MKVTVKNGKKTVKLEMSEKKARKLMFVLMTNVSWFSDVHGDVAREVYHVLEGAGVVQP